MKNSNVLAPTIQELALSSAQLVNFAYRSQILTCRQRHNLLLLAANIILSDKLAYPIVC